MPNSRVPWTSTSTPTVRSTRAAAFVEATDLRYGFNGKEIAELGGGEKQRVLELYADDFDWSDKGPIEIEPAEEEQLVIELFDDKAPMAVENFKALCVGDRGVSKNCAYRTRACGSPAIADSWRRRRLRGERLGGESIWGKKFKDEKDRLRLKSTRAGWCPWGTRGRTPTGRSSSSHSRRAKHSTKHVVFDRVVTSSGAGQDGAVAVKPGGVTEVPQLSSRCGLREKQELRVSLSTGGFRVSRARRAYVLQNTCVELFTRKKETNKRRRVATRRGGDSARRVSFFGIRTRGAS